MALGLGLLLSLILLLYATPPAGSEPSLPLLTSLLICEVGFVVTAIGAGLGIHQFVRRRMWSILVLVTIGNLLLVLNFARIALALWPETGAS